MATVDNLLSDYIPKGYKFTLWLFFKPKWFFYDRPSKDGYLKN